MTTYTREELRQMQDNDLEMVYRDVTTKPFDSTKKMNDVIDEIMTKQSESTQFMDKEKTVREKTRKKPVGKVRSTMLRSNESPKAISNLLMNTDAELDIPSYDEKNIKQNRPTLKIKNITDQIREPIHTDIQMDSVKSPRKSPKKNDQKSIPIVDNKSQVGQSKRGRPKKSKEIKEQISITEAPVVTEVEDVTEAPFVAEVEDVTEAPVVTEVEDVIEAPVVSDVVSNDMEKMEERLNDMRSNQNISDGKMEMEITIPPPPPLRKGRPKKADSISKSSSEPLKTSRRGRPPSDRTMKKTMNKSELSMSQITEEQNGVSNGLSRSFGERMVLNPNASFQKMDVVRDKEMNLSVVSEMIPISENGKRKITDFLHSVPWSKGTIPQQTSEVTIENISNGISQMTMKPKRIRASPKIRMIDDEIEQLTKRIKVLEMNRKKSNGKSIQDLISENIDIQTPKREARIKKSEISSQGSSSNLVTRIEGMSMETVPSSRSRASKKSALSDDIVNVLKEADKNKISGKRGKNYYSAEELMNFLTQIQMPTSGNKEALAQRLLDAFEKYGL
jgi:hypothetical protein